MLEEDLLLALREKCRLHSVRTWNFSLSRSRAAVYRTGISLRQVFMTASLLAVICPTASFRTVIGKTA